MPLQWTISHPTRLVVAIASGELRPEDIESYFDEVARANASAYRKLFDASQATADLSDDELMALGARIRAYVALGPIGPVAIVVPTVAGVDLRRASRGRPANPGLPRASPCPSVARRPAGAKTERMSPPSQVGVAT